MQHVCILYVYLGWASTKICTYNIAIATTQETSNELISHTYVCAYVAIPFLACHPFSSYFYPLLHIPLVVDV